MVNKERLCYSAWVKKQKKDNNKKVTGIITLNSKAVGFLPNLDLKEDIRIEADQLHTALHRDEVEVKIIGKMRGQNLGEVISIKNRNKEQFAGTIIRHENNKLYAHPDDRKMYVDILLTDKEDLKIKLNTKVLVTIVEWKDEMPVGKVEKIIGMKGDNKTEMYSIVYEKGFEIDFPEDVEKEAGNFSKEIGKDEIAKRRDMRDTQTCTIDPADAKDFDDALSFKKITNDEFEIGVHIADVSHYVRPHTALDKEAQKRAFSVYLVDRTIPMLPEKLSNDLCSLNPNEEKLAFSAVFNINKKGQIKKKWFGKTIIKSDKRFSYEEAQEVLDAGKGIMFEELSQLNSIANIFREAKFQKGAIDFEQDEVKFKLDPNGAPIGVYIKKRLATHKLVEEFMLLANKEVAIFISEIENKAGIEESPLLYRIHDEPKKDRIRDLALFVHALGYSLPHNDGAIKVKDLQSLMEQVEGKPEESLIKTASIRSMAKAIYSTKNIGHFGLAFEYYAHFTSPIRRYPDLLVHRILEKYLAGKKINHTEIAFYERCAGSSTEREIAASEAERDSIKYKQVELMQNLVGEERDGVISGVTEWGLYIEDKETKSEGMCRLRDMKDDRYELDEKNYRVVGQKTNKIYTLGTEVRFKITGASLENKSLDYLII
ncbi:MAG: ribonuclease R [bacterium]